MTELNVDPEELRWHWLRSTRDLQHDYFGIDYQRFHDDPESFADYVTWNATALSTELAEFLQEVGWKPWASPRGWSNRDRAVDELVDVAHFLANLACALDVTDDEWERRYRQKQRVNRERMTSGYSGRNKCVECGRSLDDTYVTCTVDGCIETSG